MRPTPRSDDQDFLDALLDEALRRVEEGCALVVDELAAERPDLRPQVEEIVRLARETSVGGGRSMPHLSGYSNLTELGRGGMGTVYLARQDRLAGRLVALKVLPVSAGLSPRSQERFIREVEALGRLRHPHVITIFDVMQADGVLAYAMEWIDGQSLAEWIEERAKEWRSKGSKEQRSKGSKGQRGAGPDNGKGEVSARADVNARPAAGRYGAVTKTPLGEGAAARSTAGTEAGRYGSVGFVCRLGVAIGRALGAVHRAGLLHRDVKPSNILIRRDGTPVLSDFGLVRVTDTTLTEPGMFAGTPAYSPPEQLRGESERIDARSDVYALGVTLYHALALRPPFRADRLAEVLSAADAGRFTRLRRIDPRIPADLETIVAKAMEADPARRYQSADELADDLERLLSFQPIKARPAGLATRTVKLMRRNRRSVFFAVAASIVTFTLAAAAVYLFVVPGWVSGHVREARLELLSPTWANAIWASEFWGSRHAGRHDAEIAHDSLQKALRHYDAALRLAPFDAEIRGERSIVENARDAVATQSGEGMQEESPAGLSRTSLAATPADPRCAGLQAYLAGDVEAALRAWGEYERSRALGAEPDPLVEAALGILYLTRQQPARAYPRLRTACQDFQGVAFLTMYLADAALRCGDLDDAERHLTAASEMPRHDPLGGLLRVRAGLLAARCRDAEAEALYRSASNVGPGTLDFAAFLESRGRWDDALEQYQKTAHYAVKGPPEHIFVAAMERWWSRQSPGERLSLIRGTLDANPRASNSLVGRLRLYMASRRRGASKAMPNPTLSASWGTMFPGRIAAVSLFFEISSSIHATIVSPPLQRADLTALATLLEVHDMSLWRRTVSQPRFFKEFCFASLRWPALRPLADAVRPWIECYRPAVAAFMAAVFVCTSPAVAQSDFDYDFENLNIGSIEGQDNWHVLCCGHANVALSPNGTKALNGPEAVAQSECWRELPTPFSYPAGDTVEWSFRAYMGGQGGNKNALVGVSGPNGGAGFGLDRFGGQPPRAYLSSSPFYGDWLDFGHWYEFRLVVDFGVPGGQATLSYRDLTLGQVNFIADGTLVDLNLGMIPDAQGRYVITKVNTRQDDHTGGGQCYVDNIHIDNCTMPRVLEQPPARKYVNVGQNFSIFTNTDDYSVQWRKDGVNLVNGPTGYGSEIGGATHESLFIDNAQPGDTGYYDLVVTNDCGSVQSTQCLVVVGGVPCDIDCNGTVNPFDIQPFLGLLGFGDTPCVPWAGDANFDGSVNPFDISAFLACLG